MKRRTRWIAGFSAAALVLAATATTFGYTGQVAAIVTVAAHGTVTCDVPIRVTATIVDSNGAPVSGLSVDWSFTSTQSAKDRINSSPTTTNSKGVATTTVTLDSITGTRTIRATAGDVSAAAVLGAECGGVLPNTSTLPAESRGRGAPLAAMVLVALAFLAGGLTLRRVAATNR